VRHASYADMPLRTKITLITAVTTAVVVIVVAAVLLTGDITHVRTSMVNRVSGLAEVVGANTAAAVVFDDPTAAEEVLSTLSREPLVAQAWVYSGDGSVFAEYQAPGAEPGAAVCPVPGMDGATFHGDHLHAFVTIRQGGDAVGTLVLRADTSELRERMLLAVLTAVAAMGCAVGLAVLLASKLQRFVSEPVASLAGAAQRVSETGDYSVRVTKRGDDEVGRLCDSFNDMLGQIERRDRALEFLAAIEQAGDAIVITDPDGVIEYVNPSFERITGYARTEVEGKNPRVLKSGKQEPAFYEDLWKTIGRGEVWRGHFTNRRKDGSLYEEEAIISPVRSASGAIVKYVAAKRDVTNERRIEEQMRQSQKMEAIGELAGGIAHDLNNVLTVINGHAELMLERAKGVASPMTKSATEILSGGRRAALLVKQLLAFSRRQMLQPKVLDLNALVAGMRDMLQSLVSERVEITLSLDPEAGFVEADPGQLEQVLVDLVVNARDAMPTGGRLAIGTENVTPDEEFRRSHPDRRAASYVVLSVADTGAGMPPEVMGRIFEPFFTTKGKEKGSGLGLAMVYGVVKQSGGEIDVQSAPGRGTTFRIHFPVAGTRTLREMADATAERAARGTETVLVVDDEAPVREFVSTVLKGLGYTVIQASDGLDALRAAGEHAGPVHLAITDLAMPAMGGGRLADRLSRLRPGAQVLYISSYSNGDAGRDEMLDPGMHVLRRPFSAETLARKVREVLTKHAPGSAVV